MSEKTFSSKKIIHMCNSHIGGLLGEALLKFLLKEEWIKKIKNNYFITDRGWDELEIMGIDTNKLRVNEKKAVNICSESDQGIFYEHIGSTLGEFLASKMIDLGWFNKRSETSFELTEKGFQGLESLGVKIKPYVSI